MDELNEEVLGGWMTKIRDLPFAITRPHPSITDGAERIRARFVSTALLIATTLFPILQITSESTQGFPIYSGLTFVLAGLYLLSRSEHNRLAGIIGLGIAFSIPYLMLIINQTWNETTALLHTFSWPVLTALLGSQLLKLKEEFVIISTNAIGLITAIELHPGISLGIAIEGIGISYVIAFLLIFTTWSQRYSIDQLKEANEELAEQKAEQEVYTSLLTHDLSNDLQTIIGRMELAQNYCEQETKEYANLQSAIAASNRMRSLIQIFRLVEDEIENDIVDLIESIATRAEIAYSPMKVNVQMLDSFSDVEVYISRLLPNVFENLLRNCSQYCGPEPEVDVYLKHNDEYVTIEICDNGPGIDDSIVAELFQKGITTNGDHHGLGLYLCKKIIESHNGTIQLKEGEKNSGCTFQIKLPIIENQ